MGNEQKTLSGRVPKDHWDMVEEYLEERDVSKAVFVRRATRGELARAGFDVQEPAPLDEHNGSDKTRVMDMWSAGVATAPLLLLAAAIGAVAVSLGAATVEQVGTVALLIFGLGIASAYGASRGARA
jgi:hypothetical protein